MLRIKNLILPALCGLLLANSIYFNGKLGSEIGSLKAVLISHAVGLIFISFLYLALRKQSNLFEVRRFVLNRKLFLEITAVIVFSFLLVFAANKAVNQLQAYLAIPMFLISVVTTTSICEFIFYKKPIPLFALMTVGLSVIVILFFYNFLTLVGVWWSIIAALGVYISRNFQRKISIELTPFTCTLIIYITLGLAGALTILTSLQEIIRLVEKEPVLFAGGIIGAIFQFILAITLVQHGNLRANTFIQISQIFFGLLTRFY